MTAIPDAAPDMIRRYEGWRPNVYRDPVGIPTIGFGFTKGVTMNTPPMTLAQGEARLRRELTAEYLPALRPFVAALSDNQKTALLSFVWNVGVGGVGPNTGVGRALRAHHWQAAADRLLDWDKAGGRRLEGLTRRRRAERELFLRKVRTDPLDGYREDEKRWIRAYDAEKRRAGGGSIPRLHALQREMTKRRKEIWQAVDKHGPAAWNVAHRRARYRSLLARTR